MCWLRQRFVIWVLFWTQVVFVFNCVMELCSSLLLTSFMFLVCASGNLPLDWLIGFENEHNQSINANIESSSKAQQNTCIGSFACAACGKNYTWKSSLLRHQRDECGKEPRFPCPYCPHKSKRRGRLWHHIARMHQL